MARPLSPHKAEAASAIAALLLLLLLVAASPARAQNATEAPLAIGGDRLVFNGRRASMTWRAAATAANAASSLLASAPAGADNATASSTLAVRFGRLAELDAAGEVVRRVPSLARASPSEVTNGTRAGLNGTVDFARFTYDGAALALSPCPIDTSSLTEAELLAAAAAANASAAAASVAIGFNSAASPVALAYGNETVVLPPGGFKWSIDVRSWPFCAPGNRLALDVVMHSGGSLDAAPRVYDGSDGAEGVEASFGDGLHVPGGLGAGLLGGSGEGDNEDADEADDDKGLEAAETTAAPAPAAGKEKEEACKDALRGLADAGAAWVMQAASTVSSSLSPAASPSLRRALLAEEGVVGGVGGIAGGVKSHKPKFNCSEQAGKMRAKQGAAATAALRAESAAMAEMEAGATAPALSPSSSSASTAPTTTTPAASRRLLRQEQEERGNSGNGGKGRSGGGSASSSSPYEPGRNIQGALAAARRTAAAATAATASAASGTAVAAAARANEACTSTSALLAANRALGKPRIRTPPRGPLGDAWSRAEEAAASAARTSGAAVAAAADVAGDVLCPAGGGDDKNSNSSGNRPAGAGGGNGRVKAKPPPRGRMATLLLSDGVAARLELPAFAVDGDPTDPLSPQLPVDVLFLPSAEDAAEAVTRYVFPQPVASAAAAAEAAAASSGGVVRGGRIHYDPTAAAEPAADAYSIAEIDDAASAPVATLFDAAAMSGAAAETPAKKPSAASPSASASALAAVAAGAVVMALLG